MENIMIKEVAIYHPNNTVDNEFYYQHFDARGKDIRHFLENVMGRKSRYIIDNEDENGLTMGIQAAKNVLAKAKLTGKDIDMIVFSTQVPETTFPTNAVLIHEAINADYHAITLDSNANCAGMTVAIDQTSRYMQSNHLVKRALIIGSDYNSLVSDPENEMTYANYGDAAAAVILEKTEEQAGFIDSIYYTNPKQQEFIRYPAKGLSNALKGLEGGRYIQWIPFNGLAESLPPTYEIINELLERNNLTINDIRTFCFSQYSYGGIQKIKERFAIKDEQIFYIGDMFGYTGTSSPFIALNQAIESGRVNRGDYVVFWTVGAGFQLIAMLFEY